MENSDIFIGQFKHNERSGMGTYIKFGKGLYFGEWKEGERNGRGIEFNTDNKVLYEGEWLKNFKNGFGFENYSNKSKFQGRFLKGK